MDGFSYENNCLLECLGELNVSQGPCLTPCDCEQKFRPVCGVDGLTYDNKCSLDCVGVKMSSYGVCPSIKLSCDYCSLAYMPVCGKKGVTYKNLCSINCYGDKFQNFGRCDEEFIERVTKVRLIQRYLAQMVQRQREQQEQQTMETQQEETKMVRVIPVYRLMNNKLQMLVRKSPMSQCQACPRLYRPICGTDGREYDNECLCACKGTCRKYTDGRCNGNCSQCIGKIQLVCSTDRITFDNLCYLKCANQEVAYYGPCGTAPPINYSPPIFIRQQTPVIEQESFVSP